MGEYLALDGNAIIEARVAAPPGTTLVLMRDGHPVYDTVGGALRIDVGVEPGAYRVEAHLPAAPGGRVRVPWLVSNPIYIGLRAAHEAAAAHPVARTAVTTRAPVDTSRWRAEVSAGSASVVDLGVPGDGRPAVTWRFALASDGSAPYAAAQFPLDGGIAGFDRVLLVARATRPMRLWAQVRSPGTGERWGQTFYVDEDARDIVLRLDAFRPIGPASAGTPPLAAIDSLLLVADTLNHLRGNSGEVHIRELWIAK
jgi:hypothetical protein